MRLSKILWGLGLGLAATAHAAPASPETSPRSTNNSSFHKQTTTHLNPQTLVKSTPLKVDRVKISHSKTNKPSETSPAKNSRPAATSKTESIKPVDVSSTRSDRHTMTSKAQLNKPSETSFTRSNKSATASRTKSSTKSDSPTAASKTKSQGTSRTTSSSKQTTSMSAKEKARIICESNETDINGTGTAKKGMERWKETDMDDFLSVLDDFHPGEDPPFGNYSGSLPETISDMIQPFEQWDCSRGAGGCPKITFASTETCEKNARYGLNAQWYMLSVSLTNFAQFINDLQHDLDKYAIQPLKDSIKSMDQILNPVELVNKQTNAGGELIASAVLTALSAVLFETPAKAAILAAGAGTFSFAGGALTLKNKDNDNDQQILNLITSQNNATRALGNVSTTIYEQLDQTLANLVEETPKNTWEKPYSHYPWSANKILKGGRFAERYASPILRDTSDRIKWIMTTGILSTHFDGMVIGKRTKKLFGKNPCDLKRAKLDGIPMEMARYCLNDVLYIFGRHKETDSPRQHWLSFDGWDHFVDNKGYFEDITPEDMIKDSEAAEKEYGWGKVWRPDDNLIKVAVERAKKSERLSMFTYPIVNLDDADDVQMETTKSPGGPKQHHYDQQSPLRQADRIRYMFIQASLCQTDSKGNRFPHSLWSNTISSTQTHFPFSWKGCDWAK